LVTTISIPAENIQHSEFPGTSCMSQSLLNSFYKAKVTHLKLCHPYNTYCVIEFWQGDVMNVWHLQPYCIHRQNCPLKILYRELPYIGFVSDRCKSYIGSLSI
jgi:hypothetical protein